MIMYYTFYYDPRGAWREFCEYKTLESAKKDLPKGTEWFIEKRISTLAAQSKDAAKYGKFAGKFAE